MVLSTSYYPEPVAGYLRYVLHEGQRFIRSAHIVQKGEIRLGKDNRGYLFKLKNIFLLNRENLFGKPKYHLRHSSI